MAVECLLEPKTFTICGEASLTITGPDQLPKLAILELRLESFRKFSRDNFCELLRLSKVDLTNICIRQPVKYKIPPVKPIARTPNRLNNEPEKRPAKLKAQKKALVMKAIALVSAPMLFKKSPNTKPNEDLRPSL
uniref:Uncharacterized protein n=1 Tax=Glossina palpalis gambiensis TaxID=67801 RepID=A0A1B0B6K3_9MUSC